jgi:hypothetical protein
MFHSQLWKMISLLQEVSAYKILTFIQNFKGEYPSLYRLTTSNSQLNSDSE